MEQFYCQPDLLEEGTVRMLELVYFYSWPVGIILSLCAALFLQNGRSYISGIVLVCLLLYAVDALLSLSGASFLLDRLGPYQAQQILIVSAFLILISIIYWPTRSKLVNLPLVVGIGCAVVSGALVALLSC
jgi:hypothetical protein